MRLPRLLERNGHQMRAGSRQAVLGGLLAAALTVLSIRPAAAATTAAAGFGSMTLSSSPATITADDGQNGGDTFQFTFTNTASAPASGGQVQLTVPVGWSSPGGGAVQLSFPSSSSLACKGSLAISAGSTGPWTIKVSSLACTPGQMFFLTYAANPPTTAGASTFTTLTAGNSTGIPAAIASPPSVTVQPGPAAAFSMTAPSTVMAGQAFSVSLTAMDDYGNLVPSYSVPLSQLGSSSLFSADAASTSPNGFNPIIPGPPTFSGGHATASGFTFYNAGDIVDIGADDGSGVSGSTADITVVANAPGALQFCQQPDGGMVFSALDAAQVCLTDAYGNPLTTSAIPVTLAIGANPSAGQLLGTLTQPTDATGTATFGDLMISTQGAGYTLVASSPGLAGDTSTPFEVDGVPTVSITSVKPGYGPAAGGNTVVITGLGFMNSADGSQVEEVSFGPTDGSHDATIVSQTPTTLKVQAPALPPGSSLGPVQINIVTDDGYNNPADLAASYRYGPVVTSIKPAMGRPAGGNTVTIHGTGLSRATTVLFGSKPASILHQTDTQLTVKAPAQGSAASVQVQVVTVWPGGVHFTTSIGDTSLYSYGPVITSVSPRFGPPGGGAKVTISGKNLRSVTRVKFGSASISTIATGRARPLLSGTVEVNKAGTTLTFLAPAHTVGDPGAVSVSVTTGAGTTASTTKTRYSYLPTVTGMTPATGSAAATVVRIRGFNFLGATSVNFGGSAVPLASSAINKTGTQITVAVPPSSFSSVAVVVANAAGVSQPTAAALFSYQ